LGKIRVSLSGRPMVPETAQPTEVAVVLGGRVVEETDEGGVDRIGLGTDVVGLIEDEVVVGEVGVDVVDVSRGRRVAGVVFWIAVGLVGVVAWEGLGPSGEVQPVGGTPDPVWPGISTVPAQPKSVKAACRVTEAPSLKLSVDLTCRMYPAPSIETSAVFEVKPWAWRRVSAAEIVWDSALVVPAALASWSKLLETWYTVTGTPSTVPVPVFAAASMAGWMRSR